MTKTFAGGSGGALQDALMNNSTRLLLIGGLGFSLAGCPPPDSLNSIPVASETIEWPRQLPTDLAETAWQGVRQIPEPLGMIERDFAGSLAFGDGRVAGSTGCNRFNASYMVEGDTLTFGPLAMTRMLCRGSAAQFEARFIALTQEPIRIRLSRDGRLHLERGPDLFLSYEPAK